jgi:hypothetical protein
MNRAPLNVMHVFSFSADKEKYKLIIVKENSTTKMRSHIVMFLFLLKKEKL